MKLSEMKKSDFVPARKLSVGGWAPPGVHADAPLSVCIFFLRGYENYNSGEKAWMPLAVAKDLVNDGIARRAMLQDLTDAALTNLGINADLMVSVDTAEVDKPIQMHHDAHVFRDFAADLAKMHGKQLAKEIMSFYGLDPSAKEPSQEQCDAGVEICKALLSAGKKLPKEPVLLPEHKEMEDVYREQWEELLARNTK